MNDSITMRPPLWATFDRGLISHQAPIRNEIMVRSEKKSSPLVIAFSWMIVLIPLGWGVVQSVVKSLPLFQMPSSPDQIGRPGSRTRPVTPVCSEASSRSMATLFAVDGDLASLSPAGMGRVAETSGILIAKALLRGVSLGIGDMLARPTDASGGREDLRKESTPMVPLIVVCTGLLAAEPPAATVDWKAYRTAAAAAGRDAEAHVKLALWCERQGLEPERLKHLALAVLADPKNATARGLLGLVAYRGRWERPEAVAERVRSDAGLASALEEYHERREKAPSTAEAQWKLALWCEEHGLPTEAKAHLARVVQLEPGREAAWKRLGYRRFKGSWMTPAQIAGRVAEAEAQASADRRWRPLLARWTDWLDEPARRPEAEEELARVEDPRAVPSIWRVLARGGPARQRLAVQLLGQIEGASASRALAVLALAGQSAAVRTPAIETLARRDAREVIGPLIDQVRDLLTYQVKPVGGPGDPGVLLVEGEAYGVRRRYEVPPPPEIPLQPGDMIGFDENGLAIIIRPTGGARSGAPPRFLPPGSFMPRNASGGQRIEIGRNMLEAQKATFAAGGQMMGDVAAIEAYNDAVRRANQRVLNVLEPVAGLDLGARREAWKTWWADRQGYALDKPRAKPVFDEVAPAAFDPVYSQAHSACFVAGTPVKTLTGDRPIEALAVGDRVLTQNTRTGALDYRPIVSVHANPPAATLRLKVGGDPIVATPIHRFWKAGKGWVMARDLKPGDPIRTATGTARVTAIDEAGTQAVYNLTVVDDHDFFVGQAAALVHDYVLVEPITTPFDAAPTLGSGR
jgi:hypothetical protein